jgi:hypothetical protein
MRATSLAGCLMLAVLTGCGDSGSAPSPTPSGSRTETFAGTATTGPGGSSCDSSGHPFTSGQGSLAVTLVSSSATGVKFQVCPPADPDDAACTAPAFQRLDVGQTFRAMLRGGRDQVLTVYPLDCGAPGGSATTVAYTVAVEHPS